MLSSEITIHELGDEVLWIGYSNIMVVCIDTEAEVSSSISKKNAMLVHLCTPLFGSFLSPDILVSGVSVASSLQILLCHCALEQGSTRPFDPK
jgi:hypothetical protein